MVDKKRIRNSDFHPHLRARMIQRGITKEEVKKTFKNGWKANDAKPGTFGKVFVFPYNNDWEGKYYEEKEVRVYYKITEGKITLLTSIAKYGRNFPRGGINENRV